MCVEKNDGDAPNIFRGAEIFILDVTITRQSVLRHITLSAHRIYRHSMLKIYCSAALYHYTANVVTVRIVIARVYSTAGPSYTYPATRLH